VPKHTEAPDFRVTNEGTVWVFSAKSDNAREFARNELGLERWQWRSEHTFAVDQRPAGYLVKQMQEEGWRIEVAEQDHGQEEKQRRTIREAARQAVATNDSQLFGQIAEKLRFDGFDYDDSFKWVNRWTGISRHHYERLLYEADNQDHDEYEQGYGNEPTSKVWQVKNVTGPQLRFPHDFELVAEVETNDPEIAFARTNSVEQPWPKNPGVIAHKPESRSTSSGDVVVTPQGALHHCLSFGWQSYRTIPERLPAVGFALAMHLAQQAQATEQGRATTTIFELNPAAQTQPREENLATIKTGDKADSFLASLKLEEVPYELAYNAHRGTSFNPDKRATEDQQHYLDHMQSVYARLGSLANSPEKQGLLTQEMERYRERWLEKYKECLHAESRVVSPMTSGSSNFPVSRMEKYRGWADKRVTELRDFENRAFTAIERALTPERGPIKSADAEAVEKLETKLANLEKTQALYKQINKAHAQFLKDPECLDRSDLSDKLKETIRTYTPQYSWEPHPIPPYELQNNNKEIHRLRKRIAEVSEMKASPHVETLYSGGIRVVENPDLGRIQVFFPGKPDRETINIMKAAHFRWSPNEEAWQRHLNNAGRYATQSVMTQLGEEKVEVTPTEPMAEKAVDPATQKPHEEQKATESEQTKTEATDHDESTVRILLTARLSLGNIYGAVWRTEEKGEHLASFQRAYSKNGLNNSTPKGKA
jgi:hypothetical protein